MIAFVITDAPDQQWSAVLDGRRTTMRLRYNVTTGRWSFDLAIDEEWVLQGRRIVTGVDLLAAFNFGIGAIFAMGVEPGRHDLHRGLTTLYHATEAEIVAARAA